MQTMPKETSCSRITKWLLNSLIIIKPADLEKYSITDNCIIDWATHNAKIVFQIEKGNPDNCIPEFKIGFFLQIRTRLERNFIIRTFWRQHLRGFPVGSTSRQHRATNNSSNSINTNNDSSSGNSDTNTDSSEVQPISSLWCGSRNEIEQKKNLEEKNSQRYFGK